VSAIAVVDIGTNSTRLLVRDATTVLERRVVITRLGQGVDRGRRLHPDAIARTCATLADYCAICDAQRVVARRAIATSAVRDASNREDFLDAAAAALGGVRPDVLRGSDEGRFAFAGATGWIDASSAGLTAVVDIGGGSTEFVVGWPGREPLGSISVDVGSVRLTEQWFEHDPPAPDELRNAIGVMEDALDDVVRAVPEITAATTVVGVAGTISTVAAIELGLATYDRTAVHGFTLSRAAAEDVFRTLATESLAARRHNPGLAPERADIIVGGCCALVAVMRTLGLHEIVVSEDDILDGVAAELLAL
jgi:exopolyphosphatase / guanosine-5'-triphosphate,3'-diphosphate pyrophosphatase